MTANIFQNGVPIPPGGGPSSGPGLLPVEQSCTPMGTWVGRQIDQATLQLAQANPHKLRILKQGDRATMDFIEDRINLIVDEKNNVVATRCG